MTALYIAFLVVGLLVFVAAIFGGIDHDFDFGHHDIDLGHPEYDTYADHPGLFSVRTISAFLAGFGTMGLLSKLIFEWGIGGQLLIGFGAGLLIAALAYLIMWAFYSQQAGRVPDTQDLVGKTAVITTGTGGQGIGECRVDNHHYTFREKSDTKLLPNQIAKVVEAQPGLLIVEKL